MLVNRNNEVIKSAWEGTSNVALAESFNVSPQRIGEIIRRYDPELHKQRQEVYKNRFFSESELDTIRTLRLRGATFAVIAKELGRTRNSISGACSRNNI